MYSVFCFVIKGRENVTIIFSVKQLTKTKTLIHVFYNDYIAIILMIKFVTEMLTHLLRFLITIIIVFSAHKYFIDFFKKMWHVTYQNNP